MKMKRIVFTLFLIMVALSFGYSATTTTVAAGTPAELSYTLSTDGGSNLSSIKVGFSTGDVNTLRDDLADKGVESNGYALDIKDGEFVGRLNTEERKIHVFWQILSTDQDYTINLSTSALKGTGSYTGEPPTIDVTLTAVNDQTETIKGITRTEESEGYYTATGSNGIDILEYDASSVVAKQHAGSMTIDIETDNFQGKAATDYSSKLVLKITADQSV